jgi:hypothetical protein
MKLFFIILLFSVSIFNTNSLNGDGLIGSWRVYAATNEEDVKCDTNMSSVRDFRLDILPDNYFEMQTNLGKILKTKGKYIFNDKSSTLTLYYDIGKMSYESKIPVILLEKDRLTIKYNLCGTVKGTPIISGKLELMRKEN